MPNNGHRHNLTRKEARAIRFVDYSIIIAMLGGIVLPVALMLIYGGA